MQVLELGQIWSSESLVTFAESLSETVTGANAGNLEGNRMFFTNDYMVGFSNEMKANHTHLITRSIVVLIM